MPSSPFEIFCQSASRRAGRLIPAHRLVSGRRVDVADRSLVDGIGPLDAALVTDLLDNERDFVYDAGDGDYVSELAPSARLTAEQFCPGSTPPIPMEAVVAPDPNTGDQLSEPHPDT